ncbi:hypothetical protein COCC4DRAFT_62430 [Bipolaris maydis ATCC 48331]|uniref:Uncharacterized protein n=1 Tax=Cochliobolus heterostrophus (strain C4 / ATCC 48331 / race T) TaxID=665024 RepID=N4XF38_COCH4|nr:uncharacterized protein COCC4DRAFT_62430 [Bipolaris maydis ATCC 48331]ENI03777.1 hypothetical protein COCC4DRAFT_62430 [Bipolaris maydis ATCC 48331]
MRLRHPENYVSPAQTRLSNYCIVRPLFATRCEAVQPCVPFWLPRIATATALYPPPKSSRALLPTCYLSLL